MDTRFVPEEKLIINCENFNETSALEQCIKTEIFVDNTAIGLITQGRDDELIEKLSRICRFCLVERNDLRSLFDEQNSKISMITLLSQVQIAPDDGLPQNICERCLELLIKAVNFRQQILNADMSLRHYIAVGYTKGRELQIFEIKQLPKTESENAATKIEKVDRYNQIYNMLPEEENDLPIEHMFVKKTEDSELAITSSNTEKELKEKRNEHDENFEHQKSIKTEVIEQMNINNDTLGEIHLDDKMEKQIVMKEDISLEENNIQPIDYFFVPETKNCGSIITNSYLDENSDKVRQKEEMEPKKQTIVKENAHKKRKRRPNRNKKSKISLVNEKNDCLESVTNNLTPTMCSSTYKNLKHKSSKMLHSKNSKGNNATSVVVLQNGSGKEKIVEEDTNKGPRRKSTKNILSKCSLTNEENYSLKSITDNIKSSTCSICQEIKCQCSLGSYSGCGKKNKVNNEDLNNAYQYEESAEHSGNESDLYIHHSVFGSNDQFGIDVDQPPLNSHIRKHPDNGSFTYHYSSSTDLSFNLENHSAERKYLCVQCNKKFTKHNHLVVHIRTHTGEKPYVCKICDKKFVCSSNLKVHMRIHSGEKNYVCSWCNKRFIQHNNLLTHIRTHTGEKPYVCKTCDKKFAVLQNLRCHLKIHSAEKKYCCDRCSKGFTTQRRLAQHIRTHTGEKPYVCEQCSKGFTLKSTLFNHIRKHHSPEKKYG